MSEARVHGVAMVWRRRRARARTPLVCVRPRIENKWTGAPRERYHSSFGHALDRCRSRHALDRCRSRHALDRCRSRHPLGLVQSVTHGLHDEPRRRRLRRRRLDLGLGLVYEHRALLLVDLSRRLLLQGFFRFEVGHIRFVALERGAGVLDNAGQLLRKQQSHVKASEAGIRINGLAPVPRPVSSDRVRRPSRRWCNISASPPRRCRISRNPLRACGRAPRASASPFYSWEACP
jgi:hypothetical protein